MRHLKGSTTSRHFSGLANSNEERKMSPPSHPHDLESTPNQPYSEQSHGHSEQPPQGDTRRGFFKWLTGILGGLFGAILVAPGIALLVDPLKRKSTSGKLKKLANLGDLNTNEPKLFVIRETRRDGPTLYPNEIIGRVYLIKDENDEVTCLSTTCPHLGCTINFTGEVQAEKTSFLCPCHGGEFQLNGNRTNTSNPSPHAMFRANRVDVNKDDGSVMVQYGPLKKPSDGQDPDAKEWNVT